MRSRLVAGLATISISASLLSAFAWAQSAPAHLQVLLVRQDESDCQNGNVPTGDSNVSGTVSLIRAFGSTTTVKVAITATPRTTYHFFLKCVRQLGDITTDDEGIGEGSFSFTTREVGTAYGFDMYPEGAPLGDKFQSQTARFAPP
jgi:hypothetical protein